ncbi:MAG: DUF4097 family beta strand repeat-containing protein [Acidobacteriota bacterium]
MKSKLFTSLCSAFVLSAVIFPISALADVTEKDTFEQTVGLAMTGQVEIETTNGSIEVTSWDRAEVQVVAYKKARANSSSQARELLDEIEIQIEEYGGRVSVEAVLPRSGWFGGTSTSVAFEITIPADAELEARSQNGAIKVRNLGGPAVLDTQNGSITADGVKGSLILESSNGAITARDVAGAVQAETTNGRISADIVSSALAEDVSLKTSNGSVELRIDPGVAASVYARTRNGSVSSDFEGGRMDERRRTLDLDLNGGGPRVELRSSNGSIRLRER